MTGHDAETGRGSGMRGFAPVLFLLGGTGAGTGTVCEQRLGDVPALSASPHLGACLLGVLGGVTLSENRCRLLFSELGARQSPHHRPHNSFCLQTLEIATPLPHMALDSLSLMAETAVEERCFQGE